jgi:hypothetical protein
VTPHFFAVSGVKLVVMSLATGGLYQLYWFYQHWQTIRLRTGERLLPVLRAFFGPFFAYALFRRIGAEAPPGQVSPLLLALVFIALGLLPAVPLPDPWSFIALLNILPLLEIQSQANLVNETKTPAADRNRRFSWPNVVGIAAGAALWTVAIGAMVQARSDPGSPLNLLAKAASAREGLPRTVDEGVKLIEVTASPRKLAYVYLVADEAVARFRGGPRRDDLRRDHTRAACERPDLRRMLDADVTLTHTWRSRANETLLTLTLTKASCQPSKSA